MLEHYERVKGNDHVRFPGELAMQQGLMPIAIWLGVREYGGVWGHGVGSRSLRSLAPWG